MRQWKLSMVLIVVGCNGQLTVHQDQQDSGGYAGVGHGQPDVGSVGRPCIADGTVTEAEGTVAETQILILPHCAEGSSCNEGKCAATPDCPQGTGECVVRHAALAESGSGGAPANDLGSVSSAGLFSHGGDGAMIPFSTAKSGVTALTASESRVYWVEYGTRDPLGNYLHDGALLAYAPDDGTTSVLASGLDGPIDVEVTTSHAYVYVDGARPIGTEIRAQLLRVPLTGGSTELVQEGAFPASFAAAGSQAFWTNSNTLTQWYRKIFSMTSEADAVPLEFVSDDYGDHLTVDGPDLYYVGSHGLTRSPTDSAAPVALDMHLADFMLRDDAIFAFEFVKGAGGLLTRAPKSGGEFLRVRALGAGTPSRLRRLGDRYFFETTGTSLEGAGWRLLSASFVDDAPPIQLLERPSSSPPNHLWAPTEDALYWSDGEAVYKRSLPTP